MQHISEIPLSAPITITVSSGRYATASGEVTMESLHVWYLVNTATRSIWAQVARIPHPILIYGQADFAAAVADTPAEHDARLLQILGDDIQASLASLAAGQTLPTTPPRIPREIANWRARAVLELQGLLPRIDAMIADMTGPEGIVVRQAWQAGAPLARNGATVLTLAPSLGLTSQQIDDLFIAAAALQV